MSAAPNHPDARRRLQLIVSQLDQLPTLSSVAVRLLEATSSERSSAREVIELVGADPSLSSKVLQLCSRAHRGVNLKSASIDRAVVLLGFDEVRSLAVAVEVFELMEGIASRGGETFGEETTFRREDFWRHSIAVAVTAESLVRRSRLRRTVSPGGAFLAGLLHDLGQLALYTVLPQTFDRACALAATRSVSIDSVCHRLIGATTHTIGRCLAQHWQLPKDLADTIWLAGQPTSALPENVNTTLIGIVTLADHLARAQMLTHSGHVTSNLDVPALMEHLGLERECVEKTTNEMFAEVSERAASLGLGEISSESLVRQAIERAHAQIVRCAEASSDQAHSQRTRSRIVDAISALHGPIVPGDSLPMVIRGVFASAAIAVDAPAQGVLVVDHAVGRAEYFAQPVHPRTPINPTAFRVDAPDQVSQPVEEHATITRLTPATIKACGIAGDGTALKLPCGHGISAWLVCGELNVTRFNELPGDVLCEAWGSAIGNCLANSQLAELSDQLVEANRRLVETQHALARKQTMAALGEMAAGAAHEMNNPLTVISGRAQLLSRALVDAKSDLRDAASEIARQCFRLSDLITSLRLCSESPTPDPDVVSLNDVITAAVHDVRKRSGPGLCIRVSVPADLPEAMLDETHVVHILRELLQNAQEAATNTPIDVRVQINPADDRLVITVADGGPGLSERALAHAFDPFFSEKPAGRQAGLGLARARRLAELNHGDLILGNRADGGAIATLTFATWRADACITRNAA